MALVVAALIAAGLAWIISSGAVDFDGAEIEEMQLDLRAVPQCLNPSLYDVDGGWTTILPADDSSGGVWETKDRVPTEWIGAIVDAELQRVGEKARVAGPDDVTLEYDLITGFSGLRCQISS